MADAANTAKPVKASPSRSLATCPTGSRSKHHGCKLTIAGANHPRALQTSTALNCKWGVTSNVDEECSDDWCKEARHPAVANGNIIENTPPKSRPGHRDGRRGSHRRGALDPLKPGGGVEPVPQEENED